MNLEITYPQWREEHSVFLKGLAGKRIFLLYSGGKDSSLSLDLTLRAGEEFGFDLEAHAGAFPVDRYPQEEQERLQAYGDKRGVGIVWHEMEETDEALRSAPNPCLLCQKIRKKMLNVILNESVGDWGNLVLIPSYTLWDIVSYAVEHMLSSTFSKSDPGSEDQKMRRFTEIAQRFYPLLKMKDGYTVFRPLLRYNGRDVSRAVEQQGIPILSIPCEFKEFRPKRVLERYYEKMGLSFDYEAVLDFAKGALHIPEVSAFASLGKEKYLREIF
ncbi:MAG: hypothetical protein MUO52_15075 [Desulfobacterales bacterium]|nr:hypothetical protein [Desulfobacterales bacterium]